LSSACSALADLVSNQMAEDHPSGWKRTESSVGHENFEFVTTDYNDYAVPIV